MTWTLSGVPTVTAVPLTFTVHVAPTATPGAVLSNQATIDGLALAPTAVVETSVLPK